MKLPRLKAPLRKADREVATTKGSPQKGFGEADVAWKLAHVCQFAPSRSGRMIGTGEKAALLKAERNKFIFTARETFCLSYG